MKKSAVLIAGPTASGKSQLGLSIAEAVGGVVINADSMQVYNALPILTARPEADALARAPHQLYGFVSPEINYSVGQWLEDVARALADAQSAGRVPVIVGGTGLYFSGLLEGLSPIPEIDPGIRGYWRARAKEFDGPQLHRELARRDAEMAARLEPGDVQRIVRALEVIIDTGRSLSEWQKIPGKPLLEFDDVAAFVVAPERTALYAGCDARFDQMIEMGALDEVRALMALDLDPDLPIMRALGMRDLADHLSGVLPLDEALAQAKTQTRRYAKRQLTWLRRNMIAWNPVDMKYMKREKGKILALIDN